MKPFEEFWDTLLDLYLNKIILFVDTELMERGCIIERKLGGGLDGPLISGR